MCTQASESHLEYGIPIFFYCIYQSSEGLSQPTFLGFPPAAFFVGGFDGASA